MNVLPRLHIPGNKDALTLLAACCPIRRAAHRLWGCIYTIICSLYNMYVSTTADPVSVCIYNRYPSLSAGSCPGRAGCKSWATVAVGRKCRLSLPNSGCLGQATLQRWTTGQPRIAKRRRGLHAALAMTASHPWSSTTVKRSKCRCGSVAGIDVRGLHAWMISMTSDPASCQ